MPGKHAHFLESAESLQSFLDQTEGKPDARKAFDGSRAEVADAEFDNVLGQGWNLSNCTFTRCTISGRLDQIDFRQTKFLGCDLSGAEFDHCQMIATRFDDQTVPAKVGIRGNWTRVDLRGGGKPPRSVVGAKWEGARLQGADLRDARFDDVSFTTARFSNATLKGAEFSDCEFLGASFEGAEIDGMTRFIRPQPDPPTHEYVSLVTIGGAWGWARWSTIRFLSAVPLFGVSYLGLAASVSVLTGIAWLNRSRFAADLAYPIPAPDDIALLFWSSLFLAIGSTLFALRCPERVREYSETRWVDELRHSRLEYLTEDFTRWQVQVVALATLTVGGIGALVLFLKRVGDALDVLWPWLHNVFT